jgi:hypothetical protein
VKNWSSFQLYPLQHLPHVEPAAQIVRLGQHGSVPHAVNTLLYQYVAVFLQLLHVVPSPHTVPSSHPVRGQNDGLAALREQMVSWIHWALVATSAYTPGLPGAAHPSPQLVTPMSFLVTGSKSGPPESPCRDKIAATEEC